MPHAKSARQTRLVKRFGFSVRGVGLLSATLTVGLVALLWPQSRAESVDDWKRQPPPLDLFLQAGAQPGANARLSFRGRR